jgi:hypothetical protein
MKFFLSVLAGAALIIASAGMLKPAHADDINKPWWTAAAVGDVYSRHCQHNLTDEQLGQISAILGFDAESLRAVELVDRRRQTMGDAAFCARVKERYGNFVDALPATH